jgi:hypothetical protein
MMTPTLAHLLLCLTPGVADPVDFNRDIRPLLSDNCFHCHGPDRARRKAGLRLDRREEAVEAGVIVPGKRAESPLFARVSGHLGRMPPPKSGKSLTPAQVELLGRWIDQGAKYDTHWAYKAPQRPPLPAAKDATWPRNAIDYFVLQRLEKEGLRPSPEADRATLIRRVSLDLTGLPPTPAEVDAFVADRSPDAYEKVVDRLLASPAYGERMAGKWLDLARYADTNGNRLDNHRDVWLWRDWVIGAFNSNVPFDHFTVEQLAGDLLPGATVSQRVATGFHRNTMVNFTPKPPEKKPAKPAPPQPATSAKVRKVGGDDEYRARAVMDRVATTATVWLGSTLACAQCHDHKYDPFAQKDFYRFYAFFNNVPEKGLDGEKDNPVPSIRVPSPEQAAQLAELRCRIARGRDEDELRRLQKAEAELLRSVPSAMVMEEMPQPRKTHVFLGGDYLNEGEEVTPGVPASLPPMPSTGSRVNRLDLARWLVDPKNPLTARVAVNRAWEQHFGNGLVRTVDDFGSQGEPPTHPELLDWLATEWVARGWDVKALHRQIVLSATYRQSSCVNPELRERDPDNRLLARGGRFRLDGETIRDNALSIAGLLVHRVGGPSVRPYQPAGLWEQVAVGGGYSSQTYVQSQGPDLYRRGLYTYWKRSLPHPALVAFDAPTRETCTACRPRTNTPLQALVLLNDPNFVEAARALAERILREEGSDFAGRVAHGFRLCTGRTPTEREVRVLERLYRQRLADYRKDLDAARKLVNVGASRSAPGLDVSELAAWTVVANLLLNLDEVIARE